MNNFNPRKQIMMIGQTLGKAWEKRSQAHTVRDEGRRKLTEYEMNVCELRGMNLQQSGVDLHKVSMDSFKGGSLVSLTEQLRK